MTGIELVDKRGNVRKHVAELFYEKCIKNKLRKDEIKIKQDGTRRTPDNPKEIQLEIQVLTVWYSDIIMALYLGRRD